jgi:CMP-N,N'-diacetyllegionaminic acid synthase
MENSWDVLALIPARGGSKGIPGKNLRFLGGIPLLAHALRNARSARKIGRVIVSTDSPEIAAAARSHGAEVPFLRPSDLARDESPMLGVVVHAFRAVSAAGREPGAVVLLQPTSPFLRPATIDRAVEVFFRSGAPVLQAVKRVKDHPAWMLRPEGDRLVPYLDGPTLRRQDLPELFIPCGALYIYSAGYLRAPRDREPCAWIEVGHPESLDIDEPEDLRTAERVLAEGSADLAPEGPGAVRPESAALPQEDRP